MKKLSKVDLIKYFKYWENSSDNTTEEDKKKYNETIQSFRKKFLTDKLDTLSLSDYTNSVEENTDYFLYWLEKKTNDILGTCGGQSTHLLLWHIKKEGHENKYKLNRIKSEFVDQDDALEVFNNEIKPFWQKVISLAKNNEYNKIKQSRPKGFTDYNRVNKFLLLLQPDTFIPYYNKNTHKKVLGLFLEDDNIEEDEFSRYKQFSDLLKKNIKAHPKRIASFIHHLRNEHLENIASFNSIYKDLNKMIEQGHTENTAYAHYNSEYRELHAEAGFGQGNKANIPWLALCNNRSEITKGVYPVFLYDYREKKLILCYGVSETNTPSASWKPRISKKYKTVKQHSETTRYQKKKYPQSLVRNVFNPENLNILIIKDELDSIINAYNEVTQKSNSEQNIQEVSEVPEGWKNEKNEFSRVDFNSEIDFGDLYFEDEDDIKRQVKTALRQGKHIILIGPPGTGKSKVAKQICKTYRGKDYKMTTATSDWSTFETIGGLRPNQDGKLTFKPGLFLDRFKTKETNKNEWLIVDEINRADIDKAFGSLFSVLAGDKITLPYREENPVQVLAEEPEEIKEGMYVVPDDWRLIATMNSVDKASLYEMSYAFMRRFAFIPISIPNKLDVNKYTDKWDVNISEDDQDVINHIWEKTVEERKIGPALIRDISKYVENNSDNEERFVDSISLYIIPQLEGMLEDDIKKFVESISEYDSIDKESVKTATYSFFDIKND